MHNSYVYGLHITIIPEQIKAFTNNAINVDPANKVEIAVQYEGKTYDFTCEEFLAKLGIIPA